jgi:hypothetical protein
MTDIVTYKGTAVAAFEPNSLPELIQLSEIMARSEMVPKDYRGKPGNIVVAIMAGREIGLSANQSLQSHAVINGRAMLWGDAPLGIVRASGKLARIEERVDGTGDDRVGVCIVRRVGEDKDREERFSVAMARTAGLWGNEGPWKQYPERMLKARARSFLLRDLFGDVLKGVAIAEEYEGHQEVNVTPSSPVSGNDALRERLAASMGASGLTPKPEPEPKPAEAVEGVVEEPMPDFSMMLKEQIQETLDREGHDAGMTLEQFREVITATLRGDREKRRPLNRETAVEVVRAIRAWVNPNPQAEPDAEPIAEAELPL